VGFPAQDPRAIGLDNGTEGTVGRFRAPDADAERLNSLAQLKAAKDPARGRRLSRAPSRRNRRDCDAQLVAIHGGDSEIRREQTELARCYPDDDRILLDRPKFVEHHEVIASKVALSPP